MLYPSIRRKHCLEIWYDPDPGRPKEHTQKTAVRTVMFWRFIYSLKAYPNQRGFSWGFEALHAWKSPNIGKNSGFKSDSFSTVDYFNYSDSMNMNPDYFWKEHLLDQLTMKKGWVISAYLNADPDPAFHFNADSKPTFHFYAAPAPEPDPTPWYESATTGL